MPRQVCSGAMLRCSLGSNPSVLTVQPHNRVIATNLAANIQDNKPGVNFPPFGVCVNIGGPCVPVTPNPWKLGGNPVQIGSGAILTLTETCTLICQVGGVIKVTDPGQTCVYIDQSAKSVEIPTVKANDVRSNDVDFGEGKSPGNNELTHVVQQSGTTIDRKEASNKVQKQDNQPLYQPIVEKDQDSADSDSDTRSIQDCIDFIEDVERKYSPEEQRNTKLMITRMRKIWYDREGWDKYLIKGAKDIKAPYITKRQEKERFTLELPFLFNDFDIVRQEFNVIDSQGNTPDIAINPQISLEDGSYIDMGHVFAGLDALNHPQQVTSFSYPQPGLDFSDIDAMEYLNFSQAEYCVPWDICISKNVDAVTWVGDLGSASAEIQFEWIRNDFQIPITEMQAIINKYASPQDMLGNIDAYVIGKQFDIGKTSEGKKVSEILEEYYLNGSTDQGTPSRDRRFSIFAEEVGLKNWDGTNFSNESEWIDHYTDEVNDAAAMYVWDTSEGIVDIPGRVGAVLGMSMNAGARTLVENFLNALKKYRASESLKSNQDD